MQDTENQNINLLDFQKIGKGKNGEPGNPYDILDDKIAEYITQEQLKLFILNGQPYIYRNGYYKRDEDGKILKAHIKALIWPELITISRINRVYSLILADYRLSKKNEEVNQYPVYWVNFKNGMYDPVARKLRNHSPKYFAINQIPHELNIDTEYENTTAEMFFRGLFPDFADREMFFAFAGYCMTIDTRLQKFLVLTGLPGSGKSTAINMLMAAVGADNVTSITLQDLNERFTPTELLGKLLNACADLPKKAMEQVDAIKRITGEDLIKGEYKGGKVFSFRSYAKLLFSANEMPVSLDEKSDAFFRRILMLDIRQKGPRIENLKEGLEYSMPGFIAECMRALSRMYTAGGEIDSPNSKTLVHEYHKESDNVLAFLDECTERRADVKINRAELYQKYKLYCWSHEWAPLSDKGFYRNLRGNGYADYVSCGIRYFKELDLLSALNRADNVLSRADFSPATEAENALFSRKNEK